jgi:hypothetical protein
MVTIGRDGRLFSPRISRLAGLLLSASISGLFWTLALAITARTLDLAFGATAFMAFGGAMAAWSVVGASVCVMAPPYLNRQ